MKLLLLTSVLFLSLALHAQEQPVSFTGVVQVDSASKDQLFYRARQWYNETFVNSKSVLQIADKESGELSGKGTMTVYGTYNMMGKKTMDFYSRFAINVWVKDGKYKYEVKNFEVAAKDKAEYDFGTLTTASASPVKWTWVNNKTMNDLWQSAKADNEAKVKEMIQQLDIAMHKKAASDF